MTTKLDNGRLNGWGKVVFMSLVTLFVASVGLGGPAIYHYGQLTSTMSSTQDRVTVLEGERPVLVQIQKDIARLTANSEATRDDMREMKGQMMGRPASWDHRRAEIERAGGDDETALKGPRN